MIRHDSAVVCPWIENGDRNSHVPQKAIEIPTVPLVGQFCMPIRTRLETTTRMKNVGHIAFLLLKCVPQLKASLSWSCRFEPQNIQNFHHSTS